MQSEALECSGNTFYRRGAKGGVTFRLNFLFQIQVNFKFLANLKFMGIRIMEPKELKVNQVTSKELMNKYVLDYCQRLLIGWVPGKMDDELSWAAGPEGAEVYVGELNGKNITGVAMIQHNNTYGWVGLYFCEEEHRGKGYAFKTWKTARAAIDPKVNLGLDAVVSAAPLYEREGFKQAWKVGIYDISVSSILEAYSNMTTPDGISIKPATEVNFGKLKLYTEDVIGFTFAQPGLLEKWITLPTHTAIVAVNDGGDIVGFAAIREFINCKENGHRLAPVLADTGNITRLLLLKLAKAVDSTQKFWTCVPCEINSEAKKIGDEVKGINYMEVIRMYTGGELPMKKEKHFGVFLGELVG